MCSSDLYYYSTILRPVYKVTSSGSNYTFTLLGNMDGTPVTSGATMLAEYIETNNGTNAAGVLLRVQGVAGHTVNWSVNASFTANQTL